MGEERRLVTVLFADVTESTELGESLDPEDLRALLGAYYALAKDTVVGHGGTIEKFIGDAVMAVFGIPVAHGDDAARALASALEIRDRVRRDERLAGHVRIRLGVNTGEVVAALDRSGGDFLITGDAVNIAARLQQTARPWGILCGQRTIRAAGAPFKFGPMFAVDLKGKKAAVQAAQLVGRESVRMRLHAPLVGRDGDLAQLEVIGRRALVERRPTFVSIIAPAGIGKTRLLEEFLQRLPEIAPRAVVLTGQCLPYGQRLTYWPLRAVLLRLIGASEDASPSAIRAAVRAWLGETERESPRIAEILGATIGAGEAEVSDAAAVQAAWRATIEIAAERAPLVVVLEDLHWSSDSLLDLVEFMQPRGEAPLLIVALTRPELLDRRPDWGGGRRSYLALSLAPLKDEAVEQLVVHLLPTSPPQAVRRIVARAEGNPFYAVELVRALGDRVLSADDGAALERALATLPDTVHATVLERLDLLGPEERRVMQLGAVLGRSFRAPGIAELAPDLARDVGATIEMLLAKDLVRPVATDGYAFRHIIIREVAYQTLPRGERGRLHAAAGRWLEGLAQGREEAFAELIAYHYRESAQLARAGTTAGAFDEVRRTAVRWLKRAADVAQRSAADVEAVRHLRAAAELADREELPDLYERIGDAFVSGEALDAYRRSLEIAREIGHSADQQLRAIAGMLHVGLRSGGMMERALSDQEVAELREDGRRLLAQTTSDVAVARFLAAESFHPFWVGRAGSRVPADAELDAAESSARRALEIAERHDDTRLRSAALDGLGSVLSLRGDHQAARELALRRVAMGDALDLVERLDAYAVATWASVWVGELDDAIRISGEGLAIVQPGQAPAWTLHLVSWRALAFMLRGLWDECLAAGERARSIWSEVGRAAAVFSAHGFLAALAVAHARLDEQLFERFRDTLVEIGSRSGRPAQRRFDFQSEDPGEPGYYLRYFDQRQPEALGLALSFASNVGRPPAVRFLQRLVASPRMRSFPLVHGEMQRAFGLAANDPAALVAAAAIFERCGAVPSLARARCEHGLMTGDERELREGMHMLESLGDVRQQGRYREASRPG